MEIWQAIVLGLVQGLTEFLPVSSSGHLSFFQNVLNVSTQNAQLVALIFHLGTLVAVCTVFFKDIVALFKKPFKTLGFIVIASVPAAIFGVIASLCDLDYWFYDWEWSAVLLAICFLVTAAALFCTEIYVKGRQNVLPLKLKVVIPMGIAQAIAIFPGISRSGSTICAGSFAGGKSEEIAKFSFLMSVPVILGGFVLELGKGVVDGSLQADFALGGTHYAVAIALGFVVSAVSGLFAIKVMLKAIQKANYKWFSLYLVLLAITCIVLKCVNVF